jgi:hypothetical protein
MRQRRDPRAAKSHNKLRFRGPHRAVRRAGHRGIAELRQPRRILERPGRDSDFARGFDQRAVLARYQRQLPVRAQRAHLGHDVEQTALTAAKLRFRI